MPDANIEVDVERYCKVDGTNVVLMCGGRGGGHRSNVSW